MAIWGKKTDEEPSGPKSDSPTTAGAMPDNQNNLAQLTQTLDQLGTLLRDTNQQVIAYLLRRETEQAAAAVDNAAAQNPAGQTVAADSDMLAAVLEKLNLLESRLDSVSSVGVTKSENVAGEGTPADTLAVALGQISDGLSTHHETIAAMLVQLQQQLDGGLQHLATLLQPELPDETEAAPASTGLDWQRAVLGPELAEHPGLEAQRRQLFDAALAADAGACALVGQLLVFRSAAPEKTPPVLKEIGEAYYRWQPKRSAGTDPMEQALADWLTKTCDEAGIGNRIELVHSGERFDASRHSATERGVEISQVRGWIVLRDNGKVYTKAAVDVR